MLEEETFDEIMSHLDIVCDKMIKDSLGGKDVLDRALVVSTTLNIANMLFGMMSARMAVDDTELKDFYNLLKDNVKSLEPPFENMIETEVQ